MKHSNFSLLSWIATLSISALVLPSNVVEAGARLKGNAVVEGNLITLGDVIEGAGGLASVPVAQAPAPGERVVLRVARIKSLAQKYGLEWPQTATRAMTVLRASSIVPHRQLVSKIKEALADAGVPGQIAVDLSGKIKRLHVPRGHKADVAVDDIRFDNNSGRFSALVHAPAKDRNARQIEIKGRAHAVMDVPVLVNRVPIGQKITKQDIGWIKQRLDRTGRNAVTDAGALIGMAPKRPIRTNKPVRSSDLQRPVVVGKGGTVSIVVSTPGMTLAMMGKALENGGIGDSISVMNPQTRKIIQGEVIGRGQVKVQVHRKFLAALN